ncbi:MAG: hypothetical protein RLZZ339_663 [Cyanobacteriota bacterium]|jgi:hypothetical protein|nr:hypothetical protein [Microcystis aeruginosa]
MRSHSVFHCSSYLNGEVGSLWFEGTPERWNCGTLDLLHKSTNFLQM